MGKKQQSQVNPKRHLGLLNMVRRKKRLSFQALKDRFKPRIDNWSIRHLSQGGKEVFIKAILQSIPTYTMACFLLPKSLCAKLEGIIDKFWWQKGIHWCAWNELLSLKKDGGLGFRNLAKFNIALLAKQGWRLINFPNSLLARVLKNTYVHVLAKEALKRGESYYMVGEVPHCVRQTLENFQPKHPDQKEEKMKTLWKEVAENYG
ncbi:hypothetical protein J1N35_038815 [Gossypium stocksii]|uniref:Reverse transcriptase n=1 Tax=Gossypium stocksii TaxID=47602 RepID=A0A9D3ZM53_9ROSI|nr:hypothetical protein J1N35_038815 [Gossypium stocksii]